MERTHVVIRSDFDLFNRTRLHLNNEDIIKFLRDHYGCELRLVWRDDQFEAEKEHLLESHHNPYPASNSKCLCKKCKK